jgi:hypothetical protein
VFEPTTVYDDDGIDEAKEIGKPTGDDHDVGTVTDDGIITNDEALTVLTLELMMV